MYQVFHDGFNSQSASTSRSVVFTSYFAIFCNQTRNKYSDYLFCVFLDVKTVQQEVCTDWLFKSTQNTWDDQKIKETVGPYVLL